MRGPSLTLPLSTGVRMYTRTLNLLTGSLFYASIRPSPAQPLGASLVLPQLRAREPNWPLPCFVIYTHSDSSPTTHAQ
jgi:hypothetical protein